MKTYIIGHQKPDTDSVVAAFAFKHLFESDERWGHPEPEAVISHPPNQETKFVLTKFGVKAPRLLKAKEIEPDAKVVLVDHNEETQRLEGLNPEQISDIFDHHKVSLSLNKPIFITTKSWGSMSTIAHHLMGRYGVKIPSKLAALMLCAILSDTVGFKSSTTTETDKKAARELAQLAGVKDLDALALEIFKAKSDVGSLTDKQVVMNDYKIYEFSRKTFIGQLETVEQAAVIAERKQELVEAMRAVKAELGVELMFLAISDVMAVNTKLLILGDEEKLVAERGFSRVVVDNVLDIGAKLSRKKEIAPAIEKAIQ